MPRLPAAVRGYPAGVNQVVINKLAIEARLRERQGATQSGHPVGAPQWVDSSVLWRGAALYAGDPWRALWVSLVGPLVTIGGFGAGVLLSGLRPAQTGGGVVVNPALGDGFAGGIVVCALYGGWAAWDAYQVAQRANMTAVPAWAQPVPAPQAPAPQARSANEPNDFQ